MKKSTKQSIKKEQQLFKLLELTEQGKNNLQKIACNQETDVITVVANMLGAYIEVSIDNINEGNDYLNDYGVPK